jgi:hypothetical protein
MAEYPLTEWQKELLARADELSPPPGVADLDLPAPLLRLASFCWLLSENAAAEGGGFALAAAVAGHVVGGGWEAGAAALRDLQSAGVVRRVRRGRPGEGVSIWRWTANRRRPASRGPAPWAGDQQAAAVAALN